MLGKEGTISTIFPYQKGDDDDTLHCKQCNVGVILDSCGNIMVCLYEDLALLMPIWQPPIGSHERMTRVSGSTMFTAEDVLTR